MVNTNAGLIDTFYSAIYDWFDYGAVDPGKYPAQYYQAILQQTNIGWRHVFMGHLATVWSALLIPEDQSNGIPKARYMWTASIVEVSLRWFIDLWETRNKDVHGHTKTKQNSRLKVEHQETVRHMLAQKIHMRPCNHWLFPDNPTLFLVTATANQLGTWIASRRHTVRYSIKAAK